MYWESYDNAPTDQYNPGVPFSQPPQYQQGDQFMANNFPQIPPIQDQEMPLQDTLQDSSMFQMPAPNQIPFQDQIHPVPMEESVPQTPIPQAGINEQVTQERPETPGSNVRITRSRLRGKYREKNFQNTFKVFVTHFVLFIRCSARCFRNYNHVHVEKTTS